MQTASATMSSYVVRYSKARLIHPAIALIISVVGSYMTIAGRGHWTFSLVGCFAGVGIWLLADVLLYRSTFAADAVEQRRFPGIVRRLRYADIRRVKWKSAGAGRMLLLVSTNGNRMNVYGRDDQLIGAYNILLGKIPQAFEN
jgi:hypothetical protein